MDNIFQVPATTSNVDLIHPINRLSPELLTAIFIEGPQSSPYLNHSLRLHPRAQGAPLVWMQVCKYWRDVAISTPQLWTSFIFKLNPVQKSESELDAMMAGEWLARGKSCPLLLTLRAGPIFIEANHPILDVVKAHCHRWQHIDCYLPSAAYSAINPDKRSLPMLRTLKFARKAGRYFSLQGYEHAPLLRSFSLPIDIPPNGVKVPWSQLTECSMRIEDFDTLCRLSNVVKLSLGLVPYFQFIDSFTSSITFPSLRTLRLAFTGFRDYTLLDYFIVPALSDITLEREINHSTSWAPHIFPFISRWSSTVQCITFRNAHLTEHELLICIESLPSLQKLEIDEQERSDYVTNGFIQRLQVNPGDSVPLAPKLTYIGLKGFYYHLDDDVVVDMVESRWRPRLATDNSAHQVTRLKTVMLRPERAFDRTAVVRLDQMEQEGLVVHIEQ